MKRKEKRRGEESSYPLERAEKRRCALLMIQISKEDYRDFCVRESLGGTNGTRRIPTPDERIFGYAGRPAGR
jgi:hypothetical protein